MARAREPTVAMPGGPHHKGGLRGASAASRKIASDAGRTLAIAAALADTEGDEGDRL